MVGRLKGSSLTAHRWRVALWLSAIFGVLWVLFVARGALIPFAVGAVVGYALLPLVERTVAILPIKNEGVRRGVAVFLVYIVCGGAVVLGLWLLIPILADQVGKFIAAFPSHIEAVNQSLTRLFDEYHQRVPEATQAQLDTYFRNLGDTVGAAVTTSVQRSVEFVTGTVSVIFGYLVVPFWVFYMLKDRYRMQHAFLEAMPPYFRDDIRHIFLMIDHVVGRYIRAQLILGLVVGVAVGIGMTVLGVPLAAGLAVWAGVTELVPIIGPWLGAIPGLLLVVGTNPGLIVPVALVYLIVQQLENQLLVPRLQGEATDISAGMVILLLVLGGAAFGFAGLVVAVPASAILREIFWYLDRRFRGASAHDAFAESRAARDTSEADEKATPPTHGDDVAEARGS